MKTDKSKLMKILEDRITSGPPQRIDATIIDGIFLIQTMTDLPSTFAEIAKVIISRLSSLSSRVYFACDTYRHPSIKDIERTSRSAVVDSLCLVEIREDQRNFTKHCDQSHSRPHFWFSCQKSGREMNMRHF
ncbi:hypothetical protein DPMN_176645 [Dreissena polymorpha]|uniref:Uncharacterized protein n=1 Tax=Dreissena polymorpha TaxID=45954 RepID=A0A9D4EBE0_DREPO|nr:hypothetical protein DPMN_176645 [Dreissena polymorpha]